MIEVRQVQTKKEQRDFLQFPLRLYKNNPYFVPPLYGDEKKLFRSDYVYYDTCEAVYFNAYRGSEMVGRISGILQKASNEKTGEKRIRFTRFDAVNDKEVAKALFDTLEAWALEKGMDTICGPLGFSDLEREGLLIEGFDQMSTFEEQYNAPYYKELIEALGYEKEVDWVESQVRAPKDEASIVQMEQMADRIFERYRLHIGKAKNTRDFLNKYADEFFDLLDVSYKDIYGTVPFTEGMKKMMMDNFKLIIDMRFVAVVLDENDKVVCLGICFPAIGKAVQRSGGRLTPWTLLKLLKAIKHPKSIDLGLVGVAPEYLSKGISTSFMASLARMLQQPGIDHADTNLNLENNYAIRNGWKRFDSFENKRRRSFIKHLKENEG